MKATKLQQELLRAVEAEDLKKVKTLLRQNAKPDFPQGSATTPLLKAAELGNLDIVKALVNAGADVNRRNAQSESPLETARNEGHEDIARYLRGKGAHNMVSSYSRYFNSASRKAINSGATRAKRKTIAGAPRKSQTQKTKGGSKKPARFYADDDDWGDDWLGGLDNEETKKSVPRKKTGAGPKTADDGKPVFTADNLKDIFNAANWIGKTQDMAKLWEDVPARLKKKFDFEAAYTDAHQGTLKNAHPKKLSLKPITSAEPAVPSPPKKGADGAPHSPQP